MNAGKLTATLNGHTLLQYDTDGAAYHLSTRYTLDPINRNNCSTKLDTFKILIDV